MRITIFSISVFLALCSLPTLAMSFGSQDNELIQMYTPPNMFYLNHENSKEMLSYNKAKTVRVCDKKDWVKPGINDHSVGIDVVHDGSTSMVKPGSSVGAPARRASWL